MKKKGRTRCFFRLVLRGRVLRFAGGSGIIRPFRSGRAGPTCRGRAAGGLSESVPETMSSDNYRYTRSYFSPEEIRRGLWVTIAAAVLGTVYYVQATPMSLVFARFALDLKISNPLMAILAATLPLATIPEIFMAWLIQRTGRRQAFFTWGLVLSRLLWLPIILIPFYVPAEDYGLQVTLLVSLLFLSSIISVAGGNAWGTWMGDLVPGSVLGRYFGIRTAFTTMAAMITGVLTSLYVDRHSNFHGYAWVIGVLLTFGLADIALFRWVPHPPMRPREEQHSLWDMVRIPLSNAGYRNVIILFGMWSFIAGLVNPYGGFFCLGASYAGMSMTRSAVYGAIGGGCLVLTSYFWGRLSDRWSARKVLVICLVFTLPPPFLIAMTTPEHTWTILAANILGNIGWGGIFVVMMQYLIGLAPAKERSMYLACQSATMGVITAVSCLAAGLIVKALGSLEWHVGPFVLRDLHMIFILSGVARLLCFIPLRWIPERPAQ